MRLPVLLVPLVFGSSLALAQTAPISAGDPRSVVAGLQAQGHKARLETDDAGNPMVAARGGDINYIVYFYGCENGANCLDLQFYATFDMEQPLTADFANDWNAERVFGKAFVDANGDPVLTFVVAGSPAMPPDYFASVVDVWGAAVDSFLEEIGWLEPG